MGNLAKSFESRFVIRRESHAECLRAVQHGLSYPGRAVVIDATGDPSRQLADAFRMEGWSLEFDAQGNVTSVRFIGEKLSGLNIFQAVAPFVEPGSFIDFWQEYADGDGDRPNTRWMFDGREMV